MIGFDPASMAYELEWAWDNKAYIVLWHLIFLVCWKILQLRICPYVVWKYQKWLWHRAGCPDGDPMSPTAIVAFSRNCFRTLSRNKRIRIFIRRYEGWIDTEWSPNGEGPVWAIRADGQDDEKPVDTLMADLENAGWSILTVQIPRAHVWHQWDISNGSALRYARTLLQVHKGHGRNVWGLHSYLKEWRSGPIVTPPAPSRRPFTQAKPDRVIEFPGKAAA